MSKLIQIIPNTTGWVATYREIDGEEVSVFCPIVGWALYEDGEVVALVPSTDGRAVRVDDMRGEDGELVFDKLACGHLHDEHS